LEVVSFTFETTGNSIIMKCSDNKNGYGLFTIRFLQGLWTTPIGP
jgi:hypothetical protein